MNDSSEAKTEVLQLSSRLKITARRANYATDPILKRMRGRSNGGVIPCAITSWYWRWDNIRDEPLHDLCRLAADVAATEARFKARVEGKSEADVDRLSEAASQAEWEQMHREFLYAWSIK